MSFPIGERIECVLGRLTPAQVGQVQIIKGAFWGAKRSPWALIGARLRQRELAFCLLRASTALTGTVWWSMVRRRSTVRFRKGALGYEHFSNMKLSALLRASGI